eukprot:CAMPEP_0198344476 /NCGR_PEP_ID=MMETSP1450-20131203/67927_1 /TAXON_ID=753684 ORGANISM="Madagascaria erythrocladiodes, Strain CCMP3234" /NCGR_SAMPLE_ID=MMETSP1450 /ASSEMBLY_ACC=CAM_ASM_001115 /LENGTH=53 /DNA_ID=CAMNT_0044049737 /DNA_START=58 /DNA_END=216 /DNA_ORIENTATION=+
MQKCNTTHGTAMCTSQYYGGALSGERPHTHVAFKIAARHAVYVDGMTAQAVHA